jgi:ribonuclease HI
MKITVNTDGASRGNPGPGAIGVVIANEKGEVIKKYDEFLGDRVTNNEAEYEAIIFSLKKLKLLLGKDKVKKIEVEFKSDSELLVMQLSGKYKIVEKTLQELFMKIWNLKTEFGRMDFVHVPRERNKEADKLANQALDGNSKRSLF